MASERKVDSTTTAIDVLLLCGLPGSGKSTLASSIVQYYLKKSAYYQNVVKIEYDLISQGISNNYGANSPENNEATFSSQDLEAWRETRTEALLLLQKELSTGLYNANRQEGVVCDDAKVSQMPYRMLILMDDNFHLRSMRRDVYKACQDFIIKCKCNADSSPVANPNIVMNIGLSVVHVNTALDECISNNEQRINTPHYIPQRIITNMSQTLEPPDAEKAKFEAFSIDTAQWDTNSSEFYNQLDDCLRSSICKNPIQPPPPVKSSEQLEEERLATLQSRLHRMDLLLRALVSTTCKTDTCKTDRKLAKVANDARKTILSECKNDTSLGNDNGLLNDDIWVAQRFDDIVLQRAEVDHCEEIRLALRETISELQQLPGVQKRNKE